MSLRKTRQDKIISLITTEQISTQDELIKGLKEHGFTVTQATISRDIKELKLIKKIGEGGRSVYSVGTSQNELLSAKYQTIFSGTVVSVDYAMNTCVIKTHGGMANAACAAIDAMHLDGVVGTLAGDDTIFVLCKTEDAAAKLCESVQSMVTK